MMEEALDAMSAQNHVEMSGAQQKSEPFKLGVCMVCGIIFVKKESNSNTCSENCKKYLKENNE
jgi:hypothetical protein